MYLNSLYQIILALLLAINLYFTNMQICFSSYLKDDISSIYVWEADYVDDLIICCFPLKLTAAQWIATWRKRAQSLSGDAYVEIMKSETCW